MLNDFILKDKNIVLGVCGSIAAYKSAEIIRKLKEYQASVNVVMTKNATKFITPLTLQTLSQNPVIIDLLETKTNLTPSHISLADKTDLVLIAPATANIIGKLCAGIADDALSTLVLSVKCPIVLAPAMDEQMYLNPVVKRNIALLKELGFTIVEPSEGKLASGKIGKGRLASIDSIIQKVRSCIQPEGIFAGKKFLITAGPTQEPIDSVRYITNSSTGKMGYAIASKAAQWGAEVYLISGPTNLEIPNVFEFVQVRTTDEMKDAVLKILPKTDVFISCAAPVDFRPKKVSEKKIKKKSSKKMSLELEYTPDILKEAGTINKRRSDPKILIGFSADDENLIENAKKKLNDKNLNLIIANAINQKDSGFGKDTNKIWMIDSNGKIEELPVLSKFTVAERILKKVYSIMENT
jgi:phosphopantothenoylcysteine decarboxylase/phosphopantothenate--cysteine ligase